MATETLAFSLGNSGYTEISSGQSSVLISLQVGSIRLHVGASAPAADTDNWYPVDQGGGPFPIEGLSSVENVYARAKGVLAVVRVMRG